MFKKLKCFTILFLLSFGVHASMDRALKLSTSQILKRYQVVQKEFSKYSCSKGQDARYEKLFKAYKSQKYSIPILNDTELDVDAIRSIMPEFKQKIGWIKGQIRALKAKGKISSQGYLTFRINRLIDDLLIMKEHYNNSSNNKLRESYKNKSKGLMARFSKEFDRMIAQIPFLKNYAFPVDHLKMRKDYDYYKQFSDLDSQKKKNLIYLRRKMVEDGAYSKDSKNGDIYLRSFINTLALRLSRGHEILPEDIRYDLKQVVDKVDAVLDLGYKEQIGRLEEWLYRTKKTEIFYRDLLSNYLNNPVERERTNQMFKKMARARFALEDYVFKQQSRVYKFWLKQSEINKALFSMETILINEVGSYDYSDGSEKRDVLQVVINRKDLREYNQLKASEPLVKYLNFTKLEKIKGESWLNLLFKRGEFSFTYYYIPETVRLFCPDMTRFAQKLRAQNTKLAIEQLKKPNREFHATRYFSRVSMLGGIDAGRLWSNFRSLPERVGSKVTGSKKLIAAYRAGEYHYLYSFEDKSRVKHDVVEINQKVYLIRASGESIDIYKYRDPHYFRYFRRQ